MLHMAKGIYDFYVLRIAITDTLQIKGKLMFKIMIIISVLTPSLLV